MEQEKAKKAPEEQSQKKYEYEVCEVQSAECIQKYGMYVSEPWKYAGTHILLHCGMILHYYATFGFLHPVLGAINIILHILSTISLIILAFTDPGMIPKILPTYQKVQYRKIPTNYHYNSSMLKYYQKHYWAVVKGHNLQLKFCNTCYIYRPPRTVHCEDCGICVEKFDHHCPWIGTCVAKRNYKFFLFFLGILSCLTVMLFVETIVVTVHNTQWEGAEIIAKEVINIFLCIYIFPAMGFALFMFLLHLKFAATNVTTNQFCKETWETLQGNPFKKQSWLKNILKVVSLRYQGKVKLQQRVYDRRDRMIVQNDSGMSLNDTKQVNNTIDNLNNMNDSKYKNHRNYSTNDHHDGEKSEQQNYRPLEYQYSSEMQKDGKQQQKYQQLQKQNHQLKPQNHDQMPSTLDEGISLYDIGLRLNTAPKQFKKNLEQNEIYKSHEQSQSQNLKPGSSVQSEKDRSQYRDEEFQRQEEVKLRVITEENQTEHNQESNLRIQVLQQNQKNNSSPSSLKNQFSVMKFDESQASEMGPSFSHKKNQNDKSKGQNSNKYKLNVEQNGSKDKSNFSKDDQIPITTVDERLISQENQNKNRPRVQRVGNESKLQ